MNRFSQNKGGKSNNKEIISVSTGLDNIKEQKNILIKPQIKNKITKDKSISPDKFMEESDDNANDYLNYSQNKRSIENSNNNSNITDINKNSIKIKKKKKKKTI